MPVTDYVTYQLNVHDYIEFFGWILHALPLADF